MSQTPRVLLLGDSIRMSYQPLVAGMVASRASVVGPADNCQYSLYTLSSLDRWLDDLGRPDVIHWNNGLHDCGHNPNRSPVQIPLDTYCANLRFIGERLQQLTSSIVWASTTPAHPDRPFVASQWSWHNDEIQHYNQAALALMQQLQIQVNDLHSVVQPAPDELLAEDQLHLSAAGQQACAEAVVRALDCHLDRGSNDDSQR
jgi:isoamyl acetate esterase